MKHPSGRKKKRTVKERPLKHFREENKRAISEWLRFQRLSRFYEEDLKMRAEMVLRPDRPALPLFSLEMDGVPLSELWEKNPDKAWVAATAPTERAEWADSLRQAYLAAQTSLIARLNKDDKEGFSHLLACYGPRLLAKDPLDAGPVLARLEEYWREDWEKLRKEDREELHTYGITDQDIKGSAKQRRQKDRAFLHAVGKGLAWESRGQKTEKTAEEQKEHRQVFERDYGRERKKNTLVKKLVQEIGAQAERLRKNGWKDEAATHEAAIKIALDKWGETARAKDRKNIREQAKKEYRETVNSK